MVLAGGEGKRLKPLTDDRAKPLAIPGKPTTPYERNSYLRLAKLPGVEGIWQEHLSLLDKDPNHNTSPDMIANFEETAECQGQELRSPAHEQHAHPLRAVELVRAQR